MRTWILALIVIFFGCSSIDAAHDKKSGETNARRTSKLATLGTIIKNCSSGLLPSRNEFVGSMVKQAGLETIVDPLINSARSYLFGPESTIEQQPISSSKIEAAASHLFSSAQEPALTTLNMYLQGHHKYIEQRIRGKKEPQRHYQTDDSKNPDNPEEPNMYAILKASNKQDSPTIPRYKKGREWSRLASFFARTMLKPLLGGLINKYIDSKLVSLHFLSPFLSRVWSGMRHGAVNSVINSAIITPTINYSLSLHKKGFTTTHSDFAKWAMTPTTDNKVLKVSFKPKQAA